MSKIIVITGPESTGKTTLTEDLAQHYKVGFYPEYARNYVSLLNRPYRFDDVLKIAQKQISDFCTNEFSEKNALLFFDTGLIITKVWFKIVYKKVPTFLEDALKRIKVDLYLLCYPDIPWIADGIRENGGKARVDLFNIYKQEIEYYQSNYIIIKGDKTERFLNAVNYIDSAYSL